MHSAKFAKKKKGWAGSVGDANANALSSEAGVAHGCFDFGNSCYERCNFLTAHPALDDGLEYTRRLFVNGSGGAADGADERWSSCRR